MELRKAQLLRLLNGSLCLIPLEEIKNGFFDWDNRDKNCELLKIDPPQVNLWIYRRYRGLDALGEEDHVASPPTEDELSKILVENKGLCFIQVNGSNELSSPSNACGHRSILIHLSEQTADVPRPA